jgi:acyl-CoA synthetase (NDP forming)
LKARSTGKGLNQVFYPESVAVIGASADEQAERADGWLGRLQQFGYKGRLYPINPRASRILGLQAYPSVMDVPEPVDYAIVTVRAPLVPGLLRECVSKRVRVVHIYTGGFADSGKEEGRRLQQELAEAIQGSETRVIGPNCMGVYCPASGLTLHPTFSRESGPVAVVSQTGAAMIRLVPLAHSRGIYFSKMVSYGNAVDIDSPELLEYLADDPETKYVLAYIEGVEDGPGFLNAVVRCNQKKPVAILKGGLTYAGARAISSHTATLVGAEHVWGAFFKQTRAIAVETFDEALNQLEALLYLSPPAGRRVGIVGLGGGLGVVTADICEKEGLKVPSLSEETIRDLEAMKDLAVGRGIKNPVEAGLGKSGLFRDFAEGLTRVASDSQVDFLLIQLYPEGYVQFWGGGNQMDHAMGVLIHAVKGLSKPAVTVIGMAQDADAAGITLSAHKRCWEAGLAVFSTPEAAARAVSKLIGYYESRTL